jgi:hypothetical protein
MMVETLIHPDDILREEQLRNRKRRWLELKRRSPARALEIEAYKRELQRTRIEPRTKPPLSPPKIEWTAIGEPDFYVKPGAWRAASTQTWTASDQPLRFAVEAATKKLTSDLSVQVRIAPGTYKGIQISTPKTPSLHGWEYDGVRPRLILFAEQDHKVLIEGGWAWMSGGGEIWTIGIDSCTQYGSTSCIGSPGAEGILRMKKCNSRPAIDQKQLASYYGLGQKWWNRDYEESLHTEDCELLAAAVEHIDYGDNRRATIHVRTKFGPGGRTHMQEGTRVDTAAWYGAPSRWLGTLIYQCEGHGLNSGSGGGSGLTNWGGGTGPFVIDGFKLFSKSEHPLNGNRGFSLWEAQNYGGVIDPDGDGFARDLAWINNFVSDYPQMDRPLGECESIRELHLGFISGNGHKNWIDSPDQWPSGYVGTASWIPGEYKRIEVKGTVVQEPIDEKAAA